MQEIKFRMQDGRIVKAFLDPERQIVYLGYMTMEFIRKVLKWEEVKDERKAKSKEAEEGT